MRRCGEGSGRAVDGWGRRIERKRLLALAEAQGTVGIKAFYLISLDFVRLTELLASSASGLTTHLFGHTAVAQLSSPVHPLLARAKFARAREERCLPLFPRLFLNQCPMSDVRYL